MATTAPETNHARIQPRHRFPFGVVGIALMADKDSKPENMPFLHSGTGAPVHIAVKGTLYVDATAGVLYSNLDGATGWGPTGGATLADDPGAGAFPVTASATFAITIGSSGAEAATMDDPTFVGQKVVICVDAAGSGTRVIVFGSDINVGGDATATFATERQVLVLEAILVGGQAQWEVTNNIGTVVLS